MIILLKFSKFTFIFPIVSESILFQNSFFLVEKKSRVIAFLRSVAPVILVSLSWSVFENISSNSISFPALFTYLIQNFDSSSPKNPLYFSIAFSPAVSPSNKAMYCFEVHIAMLIKYSFCSAPNPGR